MQQFTDCEGKPINVGDRVAYATKYGSSPHLEIRTVEEIIELVPHHTYTDNFMRYDQRHKERPTIYYGHSHRSDKLYVVKLNDSGGQVVSTIDNLVVIR